MKICDLYLTCDNLDGEATFTIRDEDCIETEYKKYLEIPVDLSLHVDIHSFKITGNHCYVVL